MIRPPREKKLPTIQSSDDQFLVPGKPLNIIFRAKVRDELKKAGLFSQVDNRVWKKQWVVDLEPVGSGEAAFKYLAPYSSLSRVRRRVNTGA